MGILYKFSNFEMGKIAYEMIVIFGFRYSYYNMSEVEPHWCSVIYHKAVLGMHLTEKKMGKNNLVHSTMILKNIFISFHRHFLVLKSFDLSTID